MYIFFKVRVSLHHQYNCNW